MPAMLTEYGGYGSGPKGGCTVQAACQAAGVGSAYDPPRFLPLSRVIRLTC